MFTFCLTLHGVLEFWWHQNLSYPASWKNDSIAAFAEKIAQWQVCQHTFYNYGRNAIRPRSSTSIVHIVHSEYSYIFLPSQKRLSFQCNGEVHL